MIKVDKWHISCRSLAVLVLVFSQSLYADSYLCEAERASGFVYDQENETWKASEFSIENRKYLVSRTDGSNIFVKALKYDYEIKKVNSQQPIIHCRAYRFTDSNEETGLVICRGPSGASFNFDKRSGRYIRSQPTGYVTRKTNSDTGNGPYMEIGNCSPK